MQHNGGSMSTAQPNPRPYFRTPSISPDGQQLVFLYAADLWLAVKDALGRNGLPFVIFAPLLALSEVR